MTRSGADYIRGIQDGRTVLIDGETVNDVTTHAAFKGVVESVGRVYDLANDPANRELMTFPSPKTGEPVNRSFTIPRSEEDLVLRRKALRRTAEVTFGLVGRGPEHVAAYFAAYAAHPEVLARGGQQFADNAVRFYEHIRDNDLYLSYTIQPPVIDRSKAAHEQEDPFLYAGVKEERDDGIVIRGAQMVGTAAAICDYIFMTSILRLPPGDENYALAVAIPVGAPGVRLHSRRSYAKAASSLFDYPLSSQFDETDSLVVFDDVFVPWEHVFIYRDRDIVMDQWTQTPGHILANNQAHIRLWTKMDFIAGLAHRVAETVRSIGSPPVRGQLGEIAAIPALFGGLVLAQEQNCRIDELGIAWPGREQANAVMLLQSELYPKLLGMVRELVGGGVIQLPASDADFRNPIALADIERYVQSPGVPAEERVKLFKLVWDMIGSEFASRHLQYEMFYAGAPYLVKGRMFEAYDFGRGAALVDTALGSYSLDGKG